MPEENEYVQDDAVVQEEVTATEEVNEDSNDDTVTLSKSEYSKLKRQAIAYKANKETPRQEERNSTNNALSEEAIEAKILLSQGVNPELLEEMKALAKVRGKSLLEMKTDPIIVAMEQAKEAELKAKQAKLGASRGSSTVKQTKSTTTVGLSDEDHKALWREANNK